jgi:hypothetical protein
MLDVVVFISVRIGELGRQIKSENEKEPVPFDFSGAKIIILGYIKIVLAQ